MPRTDYVIGPDGTSPSRPDPIVADLVGFGHDAMVENRWEAMMANLEGLVPGRDFAVSLLLLILGSEDSFSFLSPSGRIKLDRCETIRFFSIQRAIDPLTGWAANMAVTKMFTLLATDNHDAQVVSWFNLLREGPLDDAGRNADGG